MRRTPTTLLVRVLILAALLGGWPDRVEMVGAAVGSVVSDRTAADAATSEAARRWVVWYGDDDRIHRQQVDAGGYADLQHSLRHVREEDRQRLNNLADTYLRIDLQPVFADLAERRDAFGINLFGFSMSSALLGAALDAAEKVPPLTDADHALGLVQTAAVDELVAHFREQVTQPELTLRALRAAAGRSLALLRQDILQDCDRYDRAFRGFVLESTTTMETLDAKAGWQVDIAWRPETATFRSLCTGLRYTDPGTYLAEALVLQDLAHAELPIRKEAIELVHTIATSAIETNRYTDDTTHSLSKWGLPQSWAHPPALFISYMANTRVLARRIGEQLDRRRYLLPVREILRTSLDQLQADLTEHLKRTCDDFIATELDRVELGLAARGEGTWSTP